MAITNEDLTYKLVVDSSGMVKGYQDATGAVQDFSKVMAEADKKITESVGLLDQYGNAIKKTETDTSQATTATKQYSTATDTSSESNQEATTTLKVMDDTLTKTSKETLTFRERMKNLGMAFIAVNQTWELSQRILGTLTNALAGPIRAYGESEKAASRMANAMALQGQYSQEALASMSDWASVMQSTTTISDDLAMSLAATARATGLTDEQSKKLVETANDLAAATGRDVSDAFNELVGQFSGMRGRLVKFVPEMENLTDVQLKAGEGIDLVAKKFEGFGKGAAQTTLGTMTRLGNAWDDVQEKMGLYIKAFLNLPGSSNIAFKAIDAVSAAVDFLGNKMLWVKDQVVAFYSAFQNTVTQLGGFANIIAPIVDKLEFFALALAAIAAPTIAVQLAKIGTSLIGIVAPLVASGAQFFLVAGSFIAIAAAVDILVRNLDRVGELVDTIQVAFQNLIARITRGFRGVALAILTAFETIVDSIPTGILSKLGMDDAATSIREKMIELEKPMDGLNARVEDLNKQLKDVSKNIDLGAIGEIWKVGTEGLKVFNKELEKSQKITTQINAGPPIPENKQPAAKAGYQVPKLFDDKQMEMLKGVFTDVMPKFAGGLSESLAAPAQAIGETMTDFAGGISGLASIPLAIASAFSLVLDGIMKVLNFIPELINKVADVVNTLTDLPTKLGEAIKNLIGSVIRFFNEFLGNLFNYFDTLLVGLVDLVTKLPNAIANVFTKLPQQFVKLIERLGELIPEFVKGIITAMPKIVAAQIDFLIRGIPKIVRTLISVVVKDLGPALEAAFREAFGVIAELWRNLISGKGFDFSDLEEKVGAATNKIKETLTGVSEQLFTVMDINAQAQSSKIAEGIRDAIDSATTRTKDVLTQLWEALKRAWMWLKEKLWDPFVNAMKDAFMWIKNNIWDPFMNALKDIYMWIKTQIWDPFINALTAVFMAIKTQIWDPFINALTAVFMVIKTTIWDPFMNAIGAVWNAIKTAIFDPFSNGLTAFVSTGSLLVQALQAVVTLLQSIFNTLKANIFDPIITALSGVFNNVASIFSNINITIFAPLKAAFTSFQTFGTSFVASFSSTATTLSNLFGSVKANVFDPIISGFNSAFNGLTSIFNNIKNNVLTPFSNALSNFMNAGGTFSTLGSNIATGFQTGINKFWSTFETLGGNTAIGFQKGINKFWSTFETLGGNVGAGFQAGINKFWSTFETLGKNVASGFHAGINAIWDIFTTLGNNIAAGFKNSISNISVGGNKILPWSHGGLIYAADGAFISRGTDTVPAMLTPGEFVIKKQAVDNIGLPNLMQMNRGQMPSTGSTSINLTVTVNATEKPDEAFVRNRMMPTIVAELKRMSLDGRAVMSKKGLRE